MTIDELMAAVGGFWPGAKLVDDLTNSNRAVVARVAFSGGTYVAKCNVEPERFDNEVAALRTLPLGVRPELVAVSEGVVVMEDLGAGESLADVLLADDPSAATDALLLWARTLGAALRPSLCVGARAARLDLRDDVAQFAEFAGEFGVVADIDTDVVAIEDALSATTPWFAFGPSDACPDNNRLMPDGTLKLFDFEGASWRHAASEAAYTRAPFCTCWCVAAVPDGITDAMEDAFLAALQPPDPAGLRVATDAAVVAYILQMTRVMRWYTENNRGMAPAGVTPPTHGRQYTHGRLALLAGYAARYPAIAAVASDIASAMRDRWPDCTPLPLYPAFR